MKNIFSLILFFSIITPANLLADSPLQKWKNFSEGESARLTTEWLKKQARLHIMGNKTSTRSMEKIKFPPYYGNLGIFITLVKNHRVRGCYGAFYHQTENTPLLLVDYLKNALRSDIRYRPLSLDELDQVKIIITITSQPYPVNDLNMVDISYYGILIRDDSHQPLVLVPAEIKTHSYIKRIIRGYRNPEISVFKAITIVEALTPYRFR